MKTLSFKLNAVALAASALFSANLLAAEPSLNIGGFVDAQARWQKISPTAQNTQVTGFILNDGALYVSKEVGSTRFMLDIPFAYDDKTISSTDGTTTVVGDSNPSQGNSFKIGKDNAQGYVAWNYRDGLFGFQLGQFDSPIGFEANDSIDIFFPDSGLLGTTGFVPTTHTGLMLMSTTKQPYGSWTVKGLVANQAGKGKKGGDNFETAAQAKFEHQLFYAAFSYLYYKFANNDFKHHMVDLTVGTTIKKVKVDGELTMGKDGRALATPTSGTTGTADKWGQGYQLTATMDATDKVAVGVRGDYTRKMPNLFKAMQVSFGPTYKINDAMTLKADYSYRSVEATDGATKVKTHYLNAAGQFRF